MVPGLNATQAAGMMPRAAEKVVKQKKQPWSIEEKKLFLEAIEKFGTKALKEISEHIGTRTVIQCRSHI